MMIEVTKNGRLPIKSWASDLEDGARQQAENLANLPFTFKHIALMADAHYGWGCPVGSVVATKDIIIPAIVGVDVGCGIGAIKTSIKYTDINIDKLKNIISEIRKVIPVGFKKHKNLTETQYYQLSLQMPYTAKYGLITLDNWDNAVISLGTLGSGNHFIEIQKDNEGYIWIMVHSGSRNLGKQVAEYYNKLAVKLNTKWHSSIPKEWKLAFLPINADPAECYLTEMQYCVEYAFANRKLMMDKIIEVFFNLVPDFEILPGWGDEFGVINIAHNYVSRENHFGENVWVHRKGATLARKGTIGIIPGSQGTSSYIVKGLGNPQSFNSCSHGSGRTMSRNMAKKNLDFTAEVKALNNKGIIHSVHNIDNLDEAPGSYKDINQVMANQKDLVEILVELNPLAVIKG